MVNTPNYNEQPIAGTKYERTCRVVIENPFGAAPSAMTVEEIIRIEADGEVITKPNGNLHLTFDPANADDMIIYNLLNAKVVAARQARDAQE